MGYCQFVCVPRREVPLENHSTNICHWVPTAHPLLDNYLHKVYSQLSNCMPSSAAESSPHLKSYACVFREEKPLLLNDIINTNLRAPIMRLKSALHLENNTSQPNSTMRLKSSFYSGISDSRPSSTPRLKSSLHSGINTSPPSSIPRLKSSLHLGNNASRSSLTPGLNPHFTRGSVLLDRIQLHD